MRDRRPVLLALLVVVIALPALAQEGGGEGAMPPMGPPEELSRCDHLLGSWDVAVQYRMAPQAPWQTSQAKATTKKIMDGCAIRQDFAGSFMDMPMKGLEILTYNRETQRYESMWLDDMGARMSISAGDFADGKLVMTGEDMQMGMKWLMRTVSEQSDENTVSFTMEMSSDEGATWFESMKMVYTRSE
jgi:hypothetical protein